MEIVNISQVKPFITKDTSEIREILAPANSSLKNQSLAEARVALGRSTNEHFHPKSEEIYYILEGKGRMRIEGAEKEVAPGDGIAIPSGNRHKIWNIGGSDLVLLCCCSSAYGDEDTVMVE